ncbi:tubulin polyglutamylase ttll6 isoform X2 [Gadus macrocephalus]|uniref:tubulin polyglutamylase ttll6 isoform X2 n=1 Tax=Gadus macrocephalus TaxID=80720 RepID=UPI0028CB329A|nr:tubulin polyglutamylase ttll6 isoform X2 [Gadus macrocephalus]
MRPPEEGKSKSSACTKVGSLDKEMTPLDDLPSQTKNKKRKKRLSINMVNCRYESVRRTSYRFGLRESLEGEDFNLYWTDTSVTLDRLVGIKPYQKVNHFPGMMEVCRKDMLARNLNRMAKRFPKDYSFFPHTWCLPADYSDFQAYARAKRHKTFICKPDSGSQGKGIFLVKSAREVPHGEHIICQLYIAKPLIIDGYKFDLRIYVLVTSCDPFHIFIYKEGLARFCTSQYCQPAKTNMENICMHLTNYAINKRSENFVRDENAGSKRKLSALTCLLQERSCDVMKLWLDIDDLVIKTLASAHSVLSHSYHTCFPRHALPGSNSSGACFELLGFDVLLDQRLKPWLLEVNHSPSFTTDSALDREVKDRLLSDTLVLVNLTACDRRRAEQNQRRQIRARLQRGHCRESMEEQAVEDAQREQRVLRYEDGHLGAYRRIFPREGGDKYDKYFLHSSSLFQETAASRAREKCTREQLQELYEKQQSNRTIADRWRGLQGESAGEKRCRTSLSSLPHHTKTNTHAGSTPHLLPALPAATVCWRKEEVEEEQKRLRELRLRENLIRNLGVAKQLYNMFHDAPSSKQANAPLSVLTESHLLLRRMTTMLEPLRSDGRSFQIVPTLSVSTECGMDFASLNPPSHPISNHLPPSGSPKRSKPKSEPSLYHRQQQHHPPISTDQNPQPVPLNSQNPQGPTQAMSEPHIRAQYQPHPWAPQQLFGPDSQGHAQLRVPTPGQTHPGKPLRPQASAAALLNSCVVQTSVTVKASKRHASLPTSGSFCKLGSTKSNFAVRRSRGHTNSWHPSQLICPTGVYSDLHIVSGPAPINKRPSQCPIRHSKTPRCGTKR